MTADSDKSRCFGSGKPLYEQYHDTEWGIPVHDDQVLFEFLILEGAQAGLSWETILNKRENYRRLFHGFDPAKVATMTDNDLEACLTDAGIIRNRLKVYSTRKNAIAFLAIQQEFGSFDTYIWQYVNGTTIKNHWQRFEDVPVSTSVSDAITKDLKRRGMSFVGTTIIYAYMQAIGMVDDHLKTCWKYTDQ